MQRFGFRNLYDVGQGLAVAAVGDNSGFPTQQTNLSLYDISDPNTPAILLREILTAGEAHDLQPSFGRIYVADGTAGVHVVQYQGYDRLGVAPTLNVTPNPPAGRIASSQPILITAGVADDVHVRNVNLLIDGVRQATAGRFPFEFRMAAPSVVEDRDMTVRLVAEDTGGNSTESADIVYTVGPEVDPPVIESTSPVDGAALASQPAVSFRVSEPLEDGSLATAFSLTGSGADNTFGTADDVTIVPDDIDQNIDDLIVVVRFAAPLPADGYRAVVSTDLVDLAGNAMLADTVWDFGIWEYSPDGDGDCLSDSIEPLLGLDPVNPDSDNNGTLDGDEDFDSDNLNNCDELAFGLSPFLPDTDGDGTLDGLEDTDEDGLTDGEEIDLGTDPFAPDVEVPVVSMLRPLAGVTLYTDESKIFQADATDDGRVSFVEFWLDGVLSRVDTSAPYYHFENFAPGATTVAVEMIAEDTNGTRGSTGVVNFDVRDDLPPTVVIDTPTANSSVFEGDPIPVEATVTDDRRVNRVEFYMDGVLEFTDFSEPYATTLTAPGGVGLVQIEVRAEDQRHPPTVASVDVAVIRDYPPSVTLTGPDATVDLVEGDPLPMTTDATDDRGVVRVEFLVDGVVAVSDTTAPYAGIGLVPSGKPVVTLSARATDTIGQSTDSADEFYNVIADPGTTVIGTVFSQGNPVVGASVVVGSQSGTTLGDGTFSISGVSTTDGDIVAVGSVVQGVLTLTGQSGAAAPVRGGTTDVGAVNIKAHPGLLYDAPAFEYRDRAAKGFGVLDMNGDALPDVLAGNIRGISVLLGNGDGTLSPDLGTDVAGGLDETILGGDMDGDGVPDAVIIQRTAVRVRLGVGDGTFDPAVIYNAGGDTRMGLLLDVDGDTDLDVVTANGSGNDVSVLLGVGDGTLAAEVRYATGPTVVTVGAGDVNGDGNTDLIASNQGAFNMSQLLGNGDGTFQASVAIASSDAPTSIAVGETNGDAFDDIAAVFEGANLVQIYPGSGTGARTRTQTTTTTSRAPTVTLPTVGAPGSVRFEDVNEDGNLDLLVTGKGCVLPCSSLNLDGKVGFHFGAGDGTFGSTESIRISSDKPQDAMLADIDLDGVRDLVVFGEDSTIVLQGRGNAAFGAPATSAFSGRYANRAATGDLDGDGNLDVVVSNITGGLELLFGDGTVAFPQSSLITLNSGNKDGLRVQDVNNDGFLDILSSGLNTDGFWRLIGAGDGTFTSSFFSGGNGSVGIDSADMNQDGATDVVLSSRQDGRVAVFLSDGVGGYQPSAFTDISSSLAIRDLRVGDMNNDGSPDVVTVGGETGVVNVLLGSPTGTLTHAYDAPFDSRPIGMALADIDGDGNQDVLAAANGSGRVAVAMGRGDGTLDPVVRTDTEASVQLWLADADGDSVPDLFSTGTGVRVAPGFANGTFDAVAGVFDPGARRAYTITVGDFNNDSTPDVFASSQQDDEYSVLLHR